MLDVFRVGGGRTHDYFLHGSVRFDQKAEASFPLIPLPGEHPLLLPNETWHESKGQYDGNNDWYGAFRRMAHGQSPGHWSVTFRDTADKAGTRVTMADEDAEVYLGEGPVPARGGDRVERETIYNYWRPALMVRRQAAEGQTLQSLFVAAIEPFDGNPQIVNVERLPLRMPSLDAVAVRVTFAGGRADTYLIDLSPDSAERAEVATADGAFRLRGRVGLLSRRVDGTNQGWLIGGTAVPRGGRREPVEQGLSWNARRRGPPRRGSARRRFRHRSRAARGRGAEGTLAVAGVREHTASSPPARVSTLWASTSRLASDRCSRSITSSSATARRGSA